MEQRAEDLTVFSFVRLKTTQFTGTSNHLEALTRPEYEKYVNTEIYQFVSVIPDSPKQQEMRKPPPTPERLLKEKIVSQPNVRAHTRFSLIIMRREATQSKPQPTLSHRL